MSPPPSDYKYDVFFSYKRHELTKDWTREVYQRLQYWLTQELNVPEAQVFFDEDSMETGDRWPDKLRDALKSSRCMVCVWSPLYFQSSWCVSEWRSFRAREIRLSMQSHGLIAPMRFHDGEHFPPEARAVQCTDVVPYASTVRAFWSSPRVVDLDDVLKSFAHTVAQIVRRAPSFQADWPVVDEPGLAAAKIELARL
jgi:hypothetical protein